MNAAAQHVQTGFVSRLPAETYHALPGVSIDSKRRILWDNCARLYNLN